MSANDERNRFLVTKLAEARAKAHLTQADVAELLRKPQSFVSKYESSERRLDMAEFIEIAGIVRLDIIKTLNEFFDVFQAGRQ